MKIKNFKIILLITVIALAVSSCYKKDTAYYEDYDLTLTYYDNEFDFSSVKTYFMRDSVGFISDQIKEGDKEYKDFYKKGGPSDQILNEIVTNLKNRGYQRVDSMKNADFAMNPVITFSTNTGTIYYPGYWYGYPGYWGGYWGYYYWKYYYGYPSWGWGGYYPWYGYGGASYYQYTTHNLMIEMADGDSIRKIITWINQNPDPDWDEAPQMRYYWQSFVDGILSGDDSYDIDRIKNGIDEAFKQSEYLKN